MLVAIPAGEFTMGSEESSDESPPHRVSLRSFLMGRTEVTRRQWRSVMGSDPSYFVAGDDTSPVEQVSWDDAQVFLQKASAKAGVTLRLPTEAEWEYAAGDGAAHRRFAGADDEAGVDACAWHLGNSNGAPHPVATRRANAFGLHDMSGNVMEWCSDFYLRYWWGRTKVGGNPYELFADNPTGPPASRHHVLKGGSWTNDLFRARVANRAAYQPDYRVYHVGLRVVADLPASKQGKPVVPKGRVKD